MRLRGPQNHYARERSWQRSRSWPLLALRRYRADAGRSRACHAGRAGRGVRAVTHQPRQQFHLADDPAVYVRPSARVATVARLLECDPGDIRRLIAVGQLEAHGKGKRGVRVFLDSVQAYQERLTVIPK